MIAPTRGLLVALGAGLPIAALPVFASGLWVVWVIYLVTLAALCGLELALGLRPSQLQAQAQLSPTLGLGQGGPLSLQILAQGWAWRAPALQISAQALGALRELDVLTLPPEPAADARGAPSGTAPLSWRGELELWPLRRGRLQVHGLTISWVGPLGLWRRSRRVTLELSSDVVPMLAMSRAAALSLSAQHSVTRGAKTRRYIGDGSEFEALREFVPGLDPRGVDWRASARHRAILCRETRAERNHQIIVALDTGLLMGAPIDGMPALDHAIHAALVLSARALREGDQVGLAAFDDQTRAYCAPALGVAHLSRLQAACAALEYSSREANYALAMSELASRQRRRSVIVVMTDFTDSITAQLMVEHMQWMVRRHLILFVALRDPALERLALAPPEDPLAIHRAVLADGLLKERAVVLERLTRSGVYVIDAPPAQISAALLNRYLEIRRRELV